MRSGLLMTTLVLCASVAFAGEKKMERMERGEFAFIEEHEKELKLTDAQKKELKTLSDKTKSRREKMMESPETRQLMEEMRQARKNGDEERSKELRMKAMEAFGKDEETSPRANMQAIAKILTPEQQTKLRELREKEGRPTMAEMREGRAEKKGKGGEKTVNKPDPSRGVPSLYDNEK